MAARKSRRTAIGMQLGWWTLRVDSGKLAELAYTRIENAHKVRKKLST